MKKLGHSLRKRGVVGTAKRAGRTILELIRWHLDASFDRRYNVETSGKISLGNLEINSPHKDDATWYEPVPTLCFKQIMRDLQISHENYTFIDYGSGKGRALFLAAEYPFSRIIGIEFSPELNSMAIRNISTYRNPRQRCFNIETVCMDAADFELPMAKSLLFFYSPFKAQLFLKILDRIKESLKVSPRSLYIVFIGLLKESVQVLKQSEFEWREVALKYDYLRWEEKEALILHSGIPDMHANSVGAHLNLDRSDLPAEY